MTGVWGSKDWPQVTTEDGLALGGPERWLGLRNVGQCPDRVLETEMGVVGVDVVPGGQDCLL